jgi:hypothetical protein
MKPKPICLMLLEHDIRRAASRAAWTAGSNSPTRIPIIAMTTSSSTKVNPRESIFLQLNNLKVERLNISIRSEK